MTTTANFDLWLRTTTHHPPPPASSHPNFPPKLPYAIHAPTTALAHDSVVPCRDINGVPIFMHVNVLREYYQRVPRETSTP